MRLRAREEQRVHIRALDMDVHFDREEEVRTEISCKFMRTGLEREFAAAGLDLISWHTDEQERFAVSLTGPS
jgi:L-histidine N-alpha-methyltransferase